MNTEIPSGLHTVYFRLPYSFSQNNENVMELSLSLDISMCKHYSSSQVE